MRFTIISHVHHIQNGNQYFGYAPYIREMNIWLKYVDELVVVAPIVRGIPTTIDLDYKHPRITFKKVSDFNFINFKNTLRSIFKLPLISLQIFLAMKNADHIHLRCPGNMGLVACFVQIFFPGKSKTAKYAGNWDPKSRQPWTYKLQKYILSNTFMTRNMQVLVYGNWENQTQNIKPFFTATYSNSEKVLTTKKDFNFGMEFIFVGSLVVGKNPLYAIQLIKKIIEKGYKATLNMYGDGPIRKSLEDYIEINNLTHNIVLQGNQNFEVLKKAYQNSHFVILPSKSEGWPKAIAEGMFWGCVPVASVVSCVPFMLDYGNRGILLEMDLDNDLLKMKNSIENENSFYAKSKLASDWSQKYTTDVFESEIKKLMSI